MAEDYWKTSVVLLNNDKVFIERLRSYDKDNINPKLIARIRDKYAQDENFTPEKAANASDAAKGLWRCVCAYHHPPNPDLGLP